MNSTKYIVGGIIILLLGGLLYYIFGFHSPSGNQNGNSGAASPNPITSSVKPEMVSGPIPASSYGAGAVGSKTVTSVTPPEPISSTELGTLIGTAKPAPGAKPNYSAMKAALYDPKTNKLLTSDGLDADGSYKFIVQPGEYVLNLMPGSGTSDQLPQRIYIGKGQVLNVNFFVK